MSLLPVFKSWKHHFVGFFGTFMIDWLKADTSHNVKKWWKVACRYILGIVLLSNSLTVVKFVFSYGGSKLLISSGQRRGQNFPEINVQQPWKQSAISLTVEMEQHLADWQRSGFQTRVNGASSDTAAIAACVRKYPNIFNIIWLHVYRRTFGCCLTACSYICTPEWISKNPPPPPPHPHPLCISCRSVRFQTADLPNLSTTAATIFKLLLHFRLHWVHVCFQDPVISLPISHRGPRRVCHS